MLASRRRQIALCGLVLGLTLLRPLSGRAGDEAPAISLPHGIELHEIDFGRHVLPLMTRFGCNTGMCHGSFQGRGGFRLSLFGHASSKDYSAILDRIDADEPPESLLLTKATGRVDHGGGERFAEGSWPYQLLAAWIKQGARAPAASQGASPAMTITPAALRFENPGDHLTLSIEARFADGSRQVVTPLCRFESRDPGLVEVTAEGQVRAVRPGATQVIVCYGGGFALAPVLVPYPGATIARDAPPAESNWIDTQIARQLAQLNLPIAAAADDAQFLRRVTLDTVGRLPTADEVRQFLDDREVGKREQAIDRLLADPQHASLWATRLCDLTGCQLETMEGPDELKPVRARMWHEWFRRRLIDRVPIDRIVRTVLTGTSRGDLSADEFIDREQALVRAAQSGDIGNYPQRESLDLFYRRRSVGGAYPREALAERVAASFLGVRIQCARCHKHPNDQWTQEDYAGFVNIFGDVTFGSSTALNRALLGRLADQRRRREAGEATDSLPRMQEVYESAVEGQRLPMPGQQTPARPRPLGGAAWPDDVDPRAALVEWMKQPDNPYFARNWANRVWAQYFGRGLVDPVDGFSATNPPSHPEVLDRLAREFVQSGYDLRAIERLILTSATYQRSSTSAALDADRHYACAAIRPLMAETLVQSLDQALKSPGAWTSDVPAGRAIMDVAANRPTDRRLAYLLELFGRGERNSTCDCDRSTEPTLRQTLHLMSDAMWIEQIQKSPLLEELQAETDNKLAVDRALLQTLSRLPTASERELFLAQLASDRDRKAIWTDIIWVLVNSREFRTNH